MERKGLLWLLDEETVCPGGSDETFLDRLFSHYGDRGEINSSTFTLIMNFMCENNGAYTRYVVTCRSPNASTKSAGQQSVRFATSARNESCALHRDWLA